MGSWVLSTCHMYLQACWAASAVPLPRSILKKEDALLSPLYTIQQWHTIIAIIASPMEIN